MLVGVLRHRNCSQEALGKIPPKFHIPGENLPPSQKDVTNMIGVSFGISFKVRNKRQHLVPGFVSMSLAELFPDRQIPIHLPSPGDDHVEVLNPSGNFFLRLGLCDFNLRPGVSVSQVQVSPIMLEADPEHRIFVLPDPEVCPHLS
jgi:hypothetical protein